MLSSIWNPPTSVFLTNCLHCVHCTHTKIIIISIKEKYIRDILTTIFSYMSAMIELNQFHFSQIYSIFLYFFSTVFFLLLYVCANCCLHTERIYYNIWPKAVCFLLHLLFDWICDFYARLYETNTHRIAAKSRKKTSSISHIHTWYSSFFRLWFFSVCFFSVLIFVHVHFTDFETWWFHIRDHINFI